MAMAIIDNSVFYCQKDATQILKDSSNSNINWILSARRNMLKFVPKFNILLKIYTLPTRRLKR